MRRKASEGGKMAKNSKRSNRREVHALEQIAGIVLFQLDLALSSRVAGWFMTCRGFRIEPVSEAELEAREDRYAYATRKVIRIRPRGWERRDYVELAFVAWPGSHELLPNEGRVFHHAATGGIVRFNCQGILIIGAACREEGAILQYMRLDDTYKKLMALLHY